MTAGLALTLAGCQSFSTDVCDDATRVAGEHLEQLVELMGETRTNMFGEVVRGSGFHYTDQERAAMTAAAESYTIVVEQNADCFSVEERAEAERVARVLQDSR